MCTHCTNMRCSWDHQSQVPQRPLAGSRVERVIGGQRGMQAVHELRLGASHIQAQLAELALKRGLPSMTAESAELTCQPTEVRHSPGRSV